MAPRVQDGIPLSSLTNEQQIADPRTEIEEEEKDFSEPGENDLRIVEPSRRSVYQSYRFENPEQYFESFQGRREGNEAKSHIAAWTVN